MNRFKLFCLLLCCSLVCLNGFLPVVSYAAAQMTQIEYLYIGDDVLTIELGVVDCPSEWLEDDEISSGGSTEGGSSTSGGSIGNGNIINEPSVINHSYTYPLLIEQQKSENGNYYTSSYKVFETFTLTNLGTDITIKGGLEIGHYIGCNVFDFYDTVDDGLNYFHVVSSIKGIKLNNVNDKVILCTFGGTGPVGRVDNVNDGVIGIGYSQYNFNICDYFPGSVHLQATVEYEVTVYSSTNDFKFNFSGDDIDILSGAFDITSGNTLSAADIALQNSLLKIQQSTSNIESLQQQGNTLLQEAIDKIENQYSASDDENFGVEDIVDQVNEKAGVLSFGTDTLVNFLDLFDAANATNTKLTFPGFSMKIQGVDYQVWPDYHYDLSELENQFGALIEVVRWSCVMVVWLAVLNYLVKAYDTIFGR